ncbi:MAG: selenocysteine-specific translation elongation factor [Promethearchaeota archaeon CR_4]|nr:MAG: selenocysteine-specific translation elongation factor [Candidatus Lokiarchaeota archaeon CR_4]
MTNTQSSPVGLIPINLGILGHVDAGKTAIARRLTEIVSTAGLDAHPQSQKRGITIDLGFSFFTLGNFIVTLVDAPGHADLIRSVVSSADIIDAAILVVDGKEGPQIQTGEHLVILDAFSIKDLFIVINKVDLLSGEERQSMINKMESIMSNTKYANKTPIIPISAKTGEGFDQLKSLLLDRLHQPLRQINAPFRVVIDHHFPLKGHGTILTGTILEGVLKVGDSFIIEPLNLPGKVKTLQFAKQDVPRVQAGQRVGISVTNLDPKILYRGCLLVKDKSHVIISKLLRAFCQINPFYKENLSFGMQVHVSAGMLTISGQIYPYEVEGDLSYKIEEVNTQKPFQAILSLMDPIVVKRGDKILLSRFDLPPTTLRIAGSGVFQEELAEKPPLYRRKLKTGHVKSIQHSQGIVVEDLAQSKDGAEKIVNRLVTNPRGKIVGTFGTKGNVTIKLEDASIGVEIGQEIHAIEPREINY